MDEDQLQYLVFDEVIGILSIAQRSMTSFETE